MKISAVIPVIFCLIPLAGCYTVDTPELVGAPEFAEAVKNIKGYPEVTAAPVFPDDVKKGQYWDSAATAIMGERDRFSAPEDASGDKTDAQINRDIRNLRARVRAYKLDDPQ
ncbi:MAG: hypothetical protein GDA39_02630 [Hyphomonadaceae bacterium]|nr:hypothetical protein [Hyphomonadaceae bacterium]MBC6411860.1 hypothetical protein [Hyphomonadaceae bacterium]